MYQEHGASPTENLTDQVPWWLPEFGPWALVSFIVILVLTGKLVPAKELKYWRDAFFVEQQQKQQLLDSGKVTLEVLEALPKAAEAKDRREL